MGEGLGDGQGGGWGYKLSATRTLRSRLPPLFLTVFSRMLHIKNHASRVFFSSLVHLPPSFLPGVPNSVHLLPSLPSLPRGHSWSTRGHSWSFVVTRGHSCVLLDAILRTGLGARFQRPEVLRPSECKKYAEMLPGQ